MKVVPSPTIDSTSIVPLCSDIIFSTVASPIPVPLDLDVKYGSGAFMKTPEEALSLSKMMVNIGKILNKKILAIVTSMDEPLGRAVGNSVEIIEAIEFLKGNITDGDIAELTYDFAALSLVQLGKYPDTESAKKFIKEVISSGKALEKFRELIVTQGGDAGVIDDYTKFPPVKYTYELKADKDGYVQHIDALKIAYGGKLLGAGREKKTDEIDYGVGIFLNKKTGEPVKAGDTLCTIYSNDEAKTQSAVKYCKEGILLSDTKPVVHDLIYKIIK